MVNMLPANATMTKPAKKTAIPTLARQAKSSKNPRAALMITAMASVAPKAVPTIPQQPVPAPTPVMTAAAIRATNAVMIAVRAEPQKPTKEPKPIQPAAVTPATTAAAPAEHRRISAVWQQEPPNAEPVTNVPTAARGDKLPSAVAQNTKASGYHPRNAANPAMNASTTMIATPEELPAPETMSVITTLAEFALLALITQIVMKLIKNVITDAKQKTRVANVLNVILKLNVRIRKFTDRFMNLVVTDKHGKAKLAL